MMKDLSKMAMVYAKDKYNKRFEAFSLSQGGFVGRVHASMLGITEESKKRLQIFADKYASNGLIFQLRVKNKVVFQTQNT